MMEKVMCFPNTGVGNEKIKYEETQTVHRCYDCKFQYNLPFVAPCFDCHSLNNTGRSYFKEM